MQLLYFDTNARFTVTEDQLSTQLERDTVILNVDTGNYYSLDGVGTSIWEGIQAGSSLAVIDQNVFAKYKYCIGSEESLRDTQELMQQLLEARLIRSIH